MPACEGVVVEALVIILVVSACWWFNRRRGAGMPLSPLPGPPDPYVIAWQRGGPTAVMQLAVYDLVLGSRLAVAPAGLTEAAQAQPPRLVPLPTRAGEDALPEAARRLLALVTAPCDGARLAGFALLLAPSFAAIERGLRDDGLLLSRAQRLAGWAVTLLGMVAVLGVACWQLRDAAPGRDGGVVGIASLAAIGLCALRLLSAPEPRLSPRGRAYLVRLREEQKPAATSLRGAGRWSPASAGDPQTTRARAPDLLEVALIGMAPLNGTAYAGLLALLDPASVAPGPAALSDPSDPSEPSA